VEVHGKKGVGFAEPGGWIRKKNRFQAFLEKEV